MSHKNRHGFYERAVKIDKGVAFIMSRKNRHGFYERTVKVDMGCHFHNVCWTVLELCS
jgi:hypothetical protein